MSLSPRANYLDAIRVFATFTVIVLHISARHWRLSPVGDLDWHIYNIYDSLVRFSMPMFFMISGALFLNPQKELPLKRLYSKNIRHIATALLFWSAFYLVARNLLANIPLPWDHVLSQIALGHYHQFFLFVLLGMYIQLPLLRPIAAQKESLIYFIILAFLLVPVANLLAFHPFFDLWIGNYSGYFQVHMVQGYTGFFLWGYYLHRYSLSTEHRRMVYLLAILSCAVTILGTYYVSAVAGSSVETFYYYFLPTTYFTATAVFLWFQQRKFPEKLEKFCTFLNPITFGIYLFHDVVMNLLLSVLPTENLGIFALFTIPLLSLTVFFLSFLVIYPLYQIPFLRKWIL